MRASSARRALGAGGAVVVASAVALPALGRELGVGWEGEITDSRIVEGYEATDEVLRVPVSFEYTGPPGSVITSVTLELVPYDDRCDSRAFVQPLADGDGDASGGTDRPPTTATTATTGTTVRPPSPSENTTVSANWSFRVDPGCNGIYNLSVFATADPAGPQQPGDPGTESDPITVEGIRLSLMPPPPASAEAIVGSDRIVTVRWAAPEAWTDLSGAPADAIGYRVERVAADGPPVTVGEVGLEESSVVDDDLVAAPGGTYRYHVVSLRRGATGAAVSSAAAESTLELAAPPTTPPPNGATGGVGASRGRVGTAGRGAGQPAVATPEEFDPGFDSELDYTEFGSPEAVPPSDARLFDILTDDDPPVGVGVAVPAAVALCLAVWAGHLRHLSRRAAPPYP